MNGSPSELMDVPSSSVATAGEVGGAVLPGVQHVERREIAERDGSVEPEIGPLWSWDADRHVLVERLVTGGALGDRLLIARVLLVDPSRVVVLDLVVVPGDDPREGGVRGLKVLVGPVLRVTIAVVGEAEAPAALGILPHDVAAGVALVDVVAEEQHHVEILARHGGGGGVVALRVVLAGGEREAQIQHGADRRGRPRPADRALPAAGTEPVPVAASWLQAAHGNKHP